MIKRTVRLRVPLCLAMVEVVTGTVERAIKAFGFALEEINRAVLGAEEVFVYLASQAEPDDEVAIQIGYGGHYIRISFIYANISLPVHVLNMTAVNNPDDVSSLTEMGMFIAARVCDQVIIDKNSPEEAVVHLIIEKRYPDSPPHELPPLSDRLPNALIISPGGREEMKQAAMRAFLKYGAISPSFLHFPGKLVDMVEGQEIRILLATDGKGAVYGCVLWKLMSHCIEAFGPYLFTSHDTLGVDLVRTMLEMVSKTGAACILIRESTPDTPLSWFEELPPLTPPSDTDSRMPMHRSLPLYRQLDEDGGCVVIVHPGLATSVQRWYDQMYLSRQVITSVPAGEKPGPYTSFSVKIEKERRCASLSSITVGDDAALVLAAHQKLLMDQEIFDISYEMDLTDEMEIFLVPVLTDSGFSPEYIIPWGGIGDIMIWQARERCQ